MAHLYLYLRPQSRVMRMRHALRVAALSPHLPIVAYLLVVGIDGINTAPDELEKALPSWLALTWALALIAGGVLGIIGCAVERTRVESAGMAFLLFGTLTYAATMGSGYIAVACLGAMCASRLWELHVIRRTHREAHQLVNGGPPHE